MIHVFINICIFLAIGSIAYLGFEMYKETEMNKKPKIHIFENMIDIETAPLTDTELETLINMSFSWQPDITNTRLRMYGSTGVLYGLAATLQEDHPEYLIVTMEN